MTIVATRSSVKHGTLNEVNPPFPPGHCVIRKNVVLVIFGLTPQNHFNFQETGHVQRFQKSVIFGYRHDLFDDTIERR